MDKTKFALIIAIEKYPVASGLASELPGTNDSAEAFSRWLEEKQNLPRKGSPDFHPDNFYCCAGEDVPFQTHGTKRSDIIAAIKALANAARNKCTHLFVYISGHGFCYKSTELVNEDILVTSDFTSTNDIDAGNYCIKIQELMEVLSIHLGDGKHYYFFDACRTEVPFGDIVPLNLGMSPKRADSGKAGKAILFSAEQGLAARTNSRFSEHLVNGLHGRGRAKGWEENELYVTFDRLQSYIETQSKRRLNSQPGDATTLRKILKIEPIPSVDCKVTILNAEPEEEFQLAFRLQNISLPQISFKGPTFIAKVPSPNMYDVEVFQNTVPLKRLTPSAGLVDLYDSAEVVFSTVSLELATPPEPKDPYEKGKVTVHASEKAGVKISGIDGERKFHGPWKELSNELLPGNYRISLTESGQTVASKEIVVKAGESLEVDPTDGMRTITHTSLLKEMGVPTSGPVSFSETLDERTLDSDLGMWLSYLGASRIFGKEGSFRTLSLVPLDGDFRSLQPDHSAVSFLVSLSGLTGGCDAGIGDSPIWIPMTPVKNIPHLFEFSQVIPPGPFRLSFRSPGRSALTVSSYAVANRVTLTTLTSSHGKMPIRLYQHMLPTESQLEKLPLEVQAGFRNDPLKAVRFLVRCQRLYAQELSLASAYQGEHAETIDANMYMDLVYGKWIDPLGALLVANDLLRRGVLNPTSPLAKYRDALPPMLECLRKFFPGLPDVEALGRFLNQPGPLPNGPPILSESLTAFEATEIEKLLPLGTKRRIVGSPWVSWANAVNSSN